MKRPVIVLACGGTGGHIFPAFSLAEEIRKQRPDVKIIYVCGRMEIEALIFKFLEGQKIVSVVSAPFKGRSSLLNPIFLIKLIVGLFQSVWLLATSRPGLVVGFGGYYSFPVVIAAHWMKIKTMIHEQNVVPGAANKFLSTRVDAVALSQAESGRYLSPLKNARVTGNPVRTFIEEDRRGEALSYFGFSPERRTVLVVGGSQGAESINTFFLEALPLLDPSIKERLQILHLCGRMSSGEAEQCALRAGIPCRAFSFFQRMDLAYGAADFCVGRAGATFLAEIASRQLPAILIPYPFGGGHQSVNASVFAQTHSAVVIEQKDLVVSQFAGVLAQAVRGEAPFSLERPNGSHSGAREALALYTFEALEMSR